MRVLIYFLMLAFAVAILAGYWLFYPAHPMQIKSLTVKPLELQPGTYAEMEMDYCKTGHLAADVRLSFVNDTISPIADPYPEPLEPGCKVSTLWVKIPDNLGSGAYNIEMTRTYQVNPIRWVTVRAVSNGFHILKPVPPPPVQKVIETRAVIVPRRLDEMIALNAAALKESRNLNQKIGDLLEADRALIEANRELMKERKK